jgi:hypothetical protein
MFVKTIRVSAKVKENDKAVRGINSKVFIQEIDGIYPIII